MELSGYELSIINTELKVFLSGKVDKIFDYDDGILIRCHIPSLGKKMLRIKFPSLIFITEQKEEGKDYPGGFCMLLRKRLNQARIRSITQINLERILKIEFETKEENYELILELFGKGNVILVKEGVIISSFFRQEQRDRLIAPKKEYKLPRLRPNPESLTKEEIKEKIKTSKKPNLVKSLAADLGLGGFLAEELCDRLKIPKEQSPLEITEEISKQIFEGIILIKDWKISPKLLKQENKPLKILPFLTEKYKNPEMYKNSSFEDLESFSKGIELLTIKPVILVPKNIRKIQKILDSQKSQLKKLEEEEILYREKGNALYTHYQKIKPLLDKTSGKLSEKIKQELEELPFVKKLDLKNKKLIMTEGNLTD